MKSQADAKRRDLSFEVGEAVLLRLQPYRQKSLAKRTNEKLSARYFGPYTIVRKVGPVAYELQLPPSAKIHPIFHVSLLRPAHGYALVILLLHHCPFLPIWNSSWGLKKYCCTVWYKITGFPH